MEEHRSNNRIKVDTPVEFRAEGSQTPVRTNLSDLSLSGCYIETMFTLPVGTKVELTVSLPRPVHLRGVVVTNTPQVGNGIKFELVEGEGEHELRAYIAAASAEDAQATSSS